MVLHGQNGEDGKLQSLLDLREIKYTGSNVLSSAISIDKLTSKLILSSAGILTPLWMPVRTKDYHNYDYCKKIDLQVVEGIKNNDIDLTGKGEACGMTGILALIEAAKKS